jgi:hypothetical protein
VVAFKMSLPYGARFQLIDVNTAVCAGLNGWVKKLWLKSATETNKKREKCMQPDQLDSKTGGASATP